MANVAPGDLAYLISPIVGEKVRIVTVIRMAGYKDMFYTTDGKPVYTIKYANYDQPDWLVSCPEPVPLNLILAVKPELLHKFSNEFIAADRFLRRINGPGLVVPSELEVFAPGPITTEERVRVRDANRKKGTVK
jgi:hypothetical protein